MQTDFVEYLEIQGAIDLVPKTDLMQQVRDSGRPISDRTLTYYITKGVIPQTARVGSRQGVFPRVVVRLVMFVLDARERGVPLDSITELIPIWKELMRARYGDGVVDLAQLELIARNQVESLEANQAIPWMVLTILHPGCEVCRTEIRVLDKNGVIIEGGVHSEHVTFLITQYDPEAGFARPMSYTQLRLPGLGFDLHNDPRTVILGSPCNVQVADEITPTPPCSASDSSRRALAKEVTA